MPHGTNVTALVLVDSLRIRMSSIMRRRSGDIFSGESFMVLPWLQPRRNASLRNSRNRPLEVGQPFVHSLGETIFYSAELHRLQGELLARSPHADKRKAEASFRTAIEIAKEQGAVTLVRRANESLHRWSGR
jgi:hypothetical protein